MKSIFTAVALLALLALFSLARADDLWYMGHMGAEPCVPLRDITSDFRRVHYGAGDMRVPEDIAKGFQRMGAVVVSDKSDSKDSAFYQVSYPNGKGTYIVMFRGEERCRHMMSTVKP